MKTAPLRDYAPPQLPVGSALDEHPELLRLVPKRWQRNPVVLGALAGLCVLMSGCGKGGAKSQPSLVAPLFVHGAGRGSFGCMVINPPVLLSEGEARQVIAEEAKRAGVDLTADGPLVPGARIPLLVRGKEGVYDRRNRPLKLDGQDAKRGITYEFVSMGDAESSPSASRGTAYSIDTAHQAACARVLIAKSAPAGAHAVFYDPLVPIQTGMWETAPTISYDRAERAAEIQARAELRAQVRDFITWLRSQGVI